MDKCGEEKAAEYKESNVKRARLESTLAALLDDPLLADVPRKPSLSDVQLELGSAMHISILKLDRTSFDVAVMNSATVKDLKLVIQKTRLMNWNSPRWAIVIFLGTLYHILFNLFIWN